MKAGVDPRAILLRELHHLAETGTIRGLDALAGAFRHLAEEGLHVPVEQWKPEVEQFLCAKCSSPFCYFAANGPFSLLWVEWVLAWSGQTPAHLADRREIGAGLLRVIEQWEQANLRLAVGIAIVSEGATYFFADVEAISSGWGSLEEIIARAERGDGRALARWIALVPKSLIWVPSVRDALMSKVISRDVTFLGQLYRAARGAEARKAQERQATVLLWPAFRKAKLPRKEIHEWLEKARMKVPDDLETISRRWRRMGLYLKEQCAKVGKVGR